MKVCSLGEGAKAVARHDEQRGNSKPSFPLLRSVGHSTHPSGQLAQKSECPTKRRPPPFNVPSAAPAAASPSSAAVAAPSEVHAHERLPLRPLREDRRLPRRLCGVSVE